ncbi:MAG: hypothetical protein LQ340_007315 [Diploschistes diacapsis]|nr:MAG: hypothetical protein LQ340_007315 [Diploschistes diacapsis]
MVDGDMVVVEVETESETESETETDGASKGWKVKSRLDIAIGEGLGVEVEMGEKAGNRELPLHRPPLAFGSKVDMLLRTQRRLPARTNRTGGRGRQYGQNDIPEVGES